MGTGTRLLRRDRSAAPSGGSGRGVLVGTGARCRGMRGDWARLLREDRSSSPPGEPGPEPCRESGTEPRGGGRSSGEPGPERRGGARLSPAAGPGLGAPKEALGATGNRSSVPGAAAGSGARCRRGERSSVPGEPGLGPAGGAQGGRAPAAVLRELLTVLQIFLGFLFLESRGPPGPPLRGGSGCFAAKRCATVGSSGSGHRKRAPKAAGGAGRSGGHPIPGGRDPAVPPCPGAELAASSKEP